MANSATLFQTIDLTATGIVGIDATIKCVSVIYDTLGGDLEILAAPGADRHLGVLAISCNMSTAGRHIIQYGAGPTVVTALGHASNANNGSQIMSLQNLNLLALLPANEKLVYQGNQAWVPTGGQIWVIDTTMATIKNLMRRGYIPQLR
jgi:hypothetical protein